MTKFFSSVSPRSDLVSDLSSDSGESALSSPPAYNRRTFLAAIAGLGLSQLLSACNGQTQTKLTVRLLNRSIPPQILAEFRKVLKNSTIEATLEFTPESQMQTLFTLLQTWKQQSGDSKQAESGGIPFIGGGTPPVADLVTLGDYWLAKAVQQGLLQPLEPSKIQAWAQLPDRWKALVTRNAQGEPDPQGKVWAAPYRWGTTMIVYRRDIFQQRGLAPPSDWTDLWRSDLRRQIALPNQAREVIGLTLKKLGKSYNTAELKTVPDLEAELRALQQQVKLYSSDAYLQPLLLGDLWLAVGWSTDILPLLRRSPQLGAVVPRSGTALWADLWVRPASAATSVGDLLPRWINFCWQPQTASQLSLLSWAASPVFLPPNFATLSPELRNNPLLLPDATLLAKSEFLQPLSEPATTQYRDAWLRFRQTG